VAESKTALAKSGLTRGKAALIGVLSIVLIGVLYKQYGGSGDEASSAPTAESTNRRPPPGPGVDATSAAATGVQKEDVAVSSAHTAVDETKWEIPELAEVVQYDPFALPPSFPQPVAAIDPRLAEAGVTEPNANALAEAVEKLQTQLKELQQRGVHVIVRERDEYVAMIGDRTVHVGDEINGFTVTAIGPGGVSVERKSPE
jgi:hypothetical protein